MKFLAAIATTVALAISAAPSLAASVNLSAFGLVQGSLLAQSDEVTVGFFANFDLLDASVDDGTSLGFFDVFPSDPTSGFLNVTQPFSFTGGVVAFDIDATSAAGLFFDGTSYIYGVLTLPGGTAFDFTADTFTISGATAELYAAVAPIPLPAAAPLLVAGLGALAVAARRRRANRLQG